jgi:carbamoyltransferase
VQLVTEERLLSLARRLRRETGSPNLCLGGGVAMNCVATSKVIAAGIFSDVYVPPDPGDGGTSIGTALYTNATEKSVDPSQLTYLPDLGFAYEEESVLDLVDELDPRKIMAYRAFGARPDAFTLKRETFADAAKANARIARLLADGKIVGLFRGKYEFGPRALGQRSILTRPDRSDVALKLSRQVKHRALYRPYALSVTEEGADSLLEIPREKKRLFRWMQHSAAVTEGARSKVAAALHVDGTTRPQIVYRSENPRFHGLLGAIGELTGTAAVLNTSFNASGYPLVRTPSDALAMFVRTDMDALVINDTVIWKDFPGYDRIS